MSLPSFPHIPWSGGNGPRILGINPWIHDFAAFNFWSRPAGLLSCLDTLRGAGANVALMDCLHQTWANEPWPDSRRYGTGHYPKEELAHPEGLEHIPRRYGRYGLDQTRVKTALAALEPPPDMVLITSIMTYWYPGAFEAVTMARELWPGVPVLLGGAYATLCADHARQFSGADMVMQGALERPDNWSRLWSLLDREAPLLPPGAGLTLALDLYEEPKFAPILGSRGCPFHCEYCASNVLFPGFCQAGPQWAVHAVRHEYERGVRDFAFYDDALLVNPDKWLWPLLAELGKHCPDARLHTPNAVHIRRLSPEVCGRLRDAGVKTLRLGLETTDFDSRRDVKLTRQEWEAGARNLLDAGFSLETVGVYILYGLPGQDVEQAERAVDHVKSFGFRPHLAFYTPIPGSRLFDEACRVSPYPLRDEPVFQNNSVWPCVPGGFNWKEAGRLKSLVRI